MYFGLHIALYSVYNPLDCMCGKNQQIASMAVELLIICFPVCKPITRKTFTFCINLEYRQINQGIETLSSMSSAFLVQVTWGQGLRLEIRGIFIFTLLALFPLGFKAVDFDVFLVRYVGWLKIFLPDSISLNLPVKVLEVFTYVLVSCIL